MGGDGSQHSPILSRRSGPTYDRRTAAGDTAGSLSFELLAPIAQGIEHCPPEAGAAVRICVGALHESAGQTGHLHEVSVAQIRLWQRFGNTLHPPIRIIA